MTLCAASFFATPGFSHRRVGYRFRSRRGGVADREVDRLRVGTFAAKLPVLGAKIGLCLADHEICLAGQYVER
jgi:hypothetical protein